MISESNMKVVLQANYENMQKDEEVEKQEIKNQDSNHELKKNFIAQLQFRKEVSNNNLNDDLRNLAR
jgi:hypothetical protein